MLKISEKQYLDISRFLESFAVKEIMFKYDGIRAKKRFTLIGRNNQYYKRFDTDHPFEDILVIFNDMKIIGYYGYLEIVKEFIAYFISIYSDRVVTLITIKKQKISLLCIYNKCAVLEFQGTLDQLIALFKEKRVE